MEISPRTDRSPRKFMVAVYQPKIKACIAIKIMYYKRNEIVIEEYDIAEYIYSMTVAQRSFRHMS